MKLKKDIKPEIRRYHFIGIGGMGMGNLALLMLAKGYQISGSDVKESELTRQLRECGATIFIGHDVKNLEGVDCVVYSSAIMTTNPEMAEAVCRHVLIMKRAELLAQLVNREVGITVGGAHGKTTTSSMAAFLLMKAGLKPSTAVGGVVSQGYNAHLGIGRHFVAEVDESDGSFLYFSPHLSIITNIDFEHVDYYHSWEKIKEAYAKFVARTVEGGVVIACGDDVILRDIVGQSGRSAVMYGFGDNNDWTATHINCDANGSSYDCYHKGKFFGHFSLSVPGKHNVLNSLSVVVLGYLLKIDVEIIKETLKDFLGVNRRFQRKGEVGGVLVVDDYGHHPTEIVATLQTAKTLDRKRLVVVFQPHRYSRTKFLMEKFADCFGMADQLIVTDIYAASEKPLEGVSTDILINRISDNRPQGVVYLKKEEIVPYLLAHVVPGDLVLTLGAGDISHFSDVLVARLQARSGFDQIPVARVRSADELQSYGVIGVLMGGTSSERDVSLRSGSGVVEALIAAGCQVKALDIKSTHPDEVKSLLKSANVDMAFIMLHGSFGEDGGIQSILDELDIPYQGCSPRASYAAFHKSVAQKLFEENGVRVPRTLLSKLETKITAEDINQYVGGFPVVVKPACEGSSIGITLAHDMVTLAAAVDAAGVFGKDIIIQEYVRGREMTVGILGNRVLPIVEVQTDAEFFDFQAKYNSATTRYVVPAVVSDEAARVIQQEALKAYHSLGCEGMGRVDVIVDASDIPYVLEINTIPGFTKKSLYPKAVQAAGLDFQQLCLTLVEMAYGKKKVDSLLYKR